MRTEQEIFADLEALCASPGYIHAIAYFCLRDSMVSYAEEMTTKDTEHMFSHDRLIRTEVSTLTGLLIKNPLDLSHPSAAGLEKYIVRTEELLQEMHHAMSGSFFEGFDPSAPETFNPFGSGEAFREPIFYSAESAYTFQYRDLAPRRYANDSDWLQTNRGFTIATAQSVARAVKVAIDQNVSTTLRAMQGKPLDEVTILPGFTFASHEISDRSGIAKDIVETVLNAFALSEGERNQEFRTLHDFNVANACPLISTGPGEYILLDAYCLMEGLYDGPFYWMLPDKAYQPTASKNRGQFTEDFSAERLELVFGKEYVYRSVEIFDGREVVAEIDVLVLFGDRALVLQAKSKKLTLEARKGNDGKIREDFKKSVQDAYDQGFQCAELLIAPGYTYRERQGRNVAVPALRGIYLLCVVSDHYPSLAFQVDEFLQRKTAEKVRPPFVMDVFTLDAITEMLQSPLQFLSYIDRRVGYSDKLFSADEMAILSFHLRRNLWLEEKHDRVLLADSFAADLDVAMAVRRDGVPGKRTPDGILTRLPPTTVGRMVQQIEAKPDPATITLGFALLTLGEDTVTALSKHVDLIVERARRDHKNHDVTILLESGEMGLTVHCNNDPMLLAGPTLQNHCENRKYKQRAKAWFGVCLRPADGALRFGVNLEFPWESSAAMDARTATLASASTTGRRKKVGRNDPCPCGSQKKYKKCHLLKSGG